MINNQFVVSHSMSPQLRRLFNDEREGLSRLRDRFLGQMTDPSFGAPMRKLRYLQLVYKQCNESLAEASSWLLLHGTEMLTPLSERTFVQLELTFPNAGRQRLLSLFVELFEESHTQCALYLRGKRELTPYEQIQMQNCETIMVDRLQLRLSNAGIGLGHEGVQRSSQSESSDEDDEVEAVGSGFDRLQSQARRRGSLGFGFIDRSPGLRAAIEGRRCSAALVFPPASSGILEESSAELRAEERK